MDILRLRWVCAIMGVEIIKDMVKWFLGLVSERKS